MNYIEHSAITYRQKNKLKKATYGSLLKSARRNGIIVNNYSSSKSLMILLGIDEKAERSGSVTVKDFGENTIIFIDDKLPIKRRTFVLAHELGHIELQHPADSSKSQEDEADLFAHYLLEQTKHFTVMPLMCILLSFVITFVITFNSFTESANQPGSIAVSVSNSDTCYYTSSGTVYHLFRDCSYLKHSKHITTGTVGTCGKPKCCERCQNRKN